MIVRVGRKTSTKSLVLYSVHLKDAKMGRQNNCMTCQLIAELETNGSSEFPTDVITRKKNILKSHYK